MIDQNAPGDTDFIVVRAADQGLTNSHRKVLESHSLREPILAPDAGAHHTIGQGGVIEILRVAPKQVSAKGHPDLSVMIDPDRSLAAHDITAKFPGGEVIDLRLWLPTVTVKGLAEQGLFIRVIPGTLSVKGKFAQATGELVRPRSATEAAEAQVAAALSPEEIAAIAAQVRADETARLREEITASVTARVRAEVAHEVQAALSVFLAGPEAVSEAAAPQDREDGAEDDFGDFDSPVPADALTTDEDDFGDFEGGDDQ
ncbi:hypothetical protein [Gordonia sp. NPDC003422]